MRFGIQREALLKPLTQVVGVVERRQTLPVLANILIEVTNGSAGFTGSDLEVELSARCAVENSDDGVTTLPARKLFDIVRALPDGRVAIEGEALWIGNAETGNVNTGTLEGTHDLRGGAIAYRDGDDDWSCVLTLRFARETLEVDEPRRTCGGMNVSFGGRYFRTTAPAEQ